MQGKQNTQNSDYSDWVSQIHSVEYALNNTIHSSTHFAPATMLFSIEQRGPILDEITEVLEDKNNQPRKDLQTIRAEASTNIKKSQRNNEKQHVKHNRPAIEFEEGDFVVIKNKDSTPDSNKKLIAKFKGPYVIHKRLPNDRYVIRDIVGCQLTQLPYDGVLESNKIRRWIVPLVGD